MAAWFLYFLSGQWDLRAVPHYGCWQTIAHHDEHVGTWKSLIHAELNTEHQRRDGGWKTHEEDNSRSSTARAFWLAVAPCLLHFGPLYVFNICLNHLQRKKRNEAEWKKGLCNWGDLIMIQNQLNVKWYKYFQKKKRLRGLYIWEDHTKLGI